VQGVDGFQKGVGVGVLMRAREQVEPPRKGLWGVGRRRDCEKMGEVEWGERSEVLMGRSAAMGSESDARARSWVLMKERSAERKAWVRMVEMVGWVLSGGGEVVGRAVKAGGEKRRK